MWVASQLRKLPRRCLEKHRRVREQGREGQHRRQGLSSLRRWLLSEVHMGHICATLSSAYYMHQLLFFTAILPILSMQTGRHCKVKWFATFPSTSNWQSWDMNRAVQVQSPCGPLWQYGVSRMWHSWEFNYYYPYCRNEKAEIQRHSNLTEAHHSDRGVDNSQGSRPGFKAHTLFTILLGLPVRYFLAFSRLVEDGSLLPMLTTLLSYTIEYRVVILPRKHISGLFSNMQVRFPVTRAPWSHLHPTNTNLLPVPSSWEAQWVGHSPVYEVLAALIENRGLWTWRWDLGKNAQSS